MSILDKDILSLLELDNFSNILLKNTSNYLSKIIIYKCNDCTKLVDKIIYCGLCNLWFCEICNYIEYNCIECKKLICIDCYLENLYNSCLICDMILCKLDIKHICFYCKNPVCTKHLDYIKLCRYCNEYVCYKCMDQLIKCIICHTFFYTGNCIETICSKCK